MSFTGISSGPPPPPSLYPNSREVRGVRILPPSRKTLASPQRWIKCSFLNSPIGSWPHFYTMMTNSLKRQTVFPGSASSPNIEPGSLHHRTAPSASYHEFMILDQAGPANIACDTQVVRDFVAVKRLKVTNQSLKQTMRSFTCDTVVSVVNSYFKDGFLVVLYEQMDISLRQMTSILQGPLKPFQIASICKEVK